MRKRSTTARRYGAPCEHELEGVVAKPGRSRYVPGERGRIKTKNTAHWRYELEREGWLGVAALCRFSAFKSIYAANA
jgi:hypothetical protein